MKHTISIILTAITLTLATAAAQTNSIDQRANLLNQIREDPTNPELHYQLGALELFTFGDPDAAAFHYATATTTGVRYDTLHNEAVAHAQAGRYIQATYLLNNALEQNPSPENQATTLELLGDVLHTAADYEAAADTYAQLHQLTNSPNAQYKHLRARYANGETTSLIIPLQQLRSTAKPHATELLALIYQTAGMTDYATNELQLARAEAIEQGDLQSLARISIHLAQNHYAADEYDEALAAITDIHLITNEQTASYTEGVIHLAMGQPDLAFEAFTRDHQPHELIPERLMGAVIASANTLNPTDIARYMRAYLTNHTADTLNHGYLPRTATLAALELLGQHPTHSALAEELSRGINLSSYRPEQLLTLGTIHYDNGDYEAAAAAFSAAGAHELATEEQKLASLRNHAHALQANKQHTAADRAYREYLSLAPYDTTALYHHGWALLHAGEANEAEQAWREAHSRGYEPASDALKHLPN